MSSHYWCQSQDLVGYWTRLDSNILLLKHLHEKWVSSYGVSVANAFGVEQNGVKEIAVYFVAHLKRLAAMEEEWYVQILLVALLPEVQEFWNELLELMAHFLVPNEIKSF